MALSGTKALLVWTQRMTEGYKDVKVKDMQRSWKDGLAFCAILHHYRPDLIDFDSLSKENVRENNKLAFDVAEEELGIPALLDPDDMATMLVPDRLSIMTYVSQYYNYFKDKLPIKDVGGLKVRTPTKRPAGDSPLHHVPNKQPSMGDTCSICSKKVFLVERQVADGKLYHRNCFRCTQCSTTLRPGSYKTTTNPKKFECLGHGENIWKLRSNIAGRVAKDKASQDSGNGGNIWEARPGIVKPSDAGNVGSPWEKRTDVKTVPSAKPTPRDNGGVGSLWEARAGLKPVTGVRVSDGNQSDAKETPVKNGRPDALPHKPQVPVASQQTPNKPAIPVHPHILASKAARERFNSPVTPQEKPQKPVTSVSASNLASPEKRPDSVAAKAEDTRQGLLASLAAVRENLKPETAPSKEDLLDVLEGGNGPKLPVGEESKEPSPAGSNWSLISDAQQVLVINTSPEQQKESKDSSPEHDETKGEPEPRSRDSGQTSSDVLSLTSVSSVSPNDNSEASSVDAERLKFASGIEPGSRSSAFSRNSFSDQEGNTGTNLNLSDSFCVEYNSDKVERDASGKSDQDKQIIAEKDTDKEKEVPKEPDSSKEGHEGYDETLNPFGDDEEEEEELGTKEENLDDGYKNPFDESDSEDEAYDDSLNPFGDDDDDETAPGSPVTQWPPQPTGMPEIPNQQASYKVKTRQEILQEMQRDRHTLKKRRAPTRPAGAPPRPVSTPPRPEGTPPRPEGTPPTSRLPPRRDTTPGNTPKRPPPRSKKNRRAPTPPEDGSTQPQLIKRPDRPPPPSPSNRDQRTNSDVSAKPAPSPRLRKVIKPDIGEDGRISPVPTPRKKHSEGLKIDENESPVPSPRMRRATNVLLDKKVKPPRPSSDPIRPPSAMSQGSRKRAPAPPPIKREVAQHHVDPAIIQKELSKIEIKQLELESKGVQLEKKLRTDMEGKESQENEELLVEWFALVNEKNQLLRREGELVAHVAGGKEKSINWCKERYRNLVPANIRKPVKKAFRFLSKGRFQSLPDFSPAQKLMEASLSSLKLPGIGTSIDTFPCSLGSSNLFQPAGLLSTSNLDKPESPPEAATSQAAMPRSSACEVIMPDSVYSMPVTLSEDISHESHKRENTSVAPPAKKQQEYEERKLAILEEEHTMRSRMLQAQARYYEIKADALLKEIAQMQDLELQQAEIEYELRCLMHKHEHQKTDADVEREEKLLELLVEAVTKRSQIVERLEDDRKREEAEDEDIQNMLEQSGLDKKNMEKKRKKKRGSLPGN